MHKIELSGITIDVIRKDIKNMHLAVYPPTGRVRIAAPLSISDDAIRLFVLSRLGWIKRNQRKFGAQERQSPREYKERESHYYLGRRYLLKSIEENAYPKILLKNRTLELHIRPGTPVEKRHEIMNNWYRKEIKKLIPVYIEKWEAILGVKVNDWQVKQMKTKWGSCNIEDRRIWINLELAKKPVQCLEYIIVHEMAHFRERHHDERFQTLMDTFLPTWRKIKSELNRLPVSHAEWAY